jgi:hypothetical protein
MLSGSSSQRVVIDRSSRHERGRKSGLLSLSLITVEAVDPNQLAGESVDVRSSADLVVHAGRTVARVVRKVRKR